MLLEWYSKDQDLEETVFMAAMYWRIIFGTARAFLGYKLLSLVGLPAIAAYQHLLRGELAESHDAVFQIIGRQLVHHGFSITYFLAAYLLFWGFMDIALSISMLRHYLWAFAVSLTLMCLFIAYEVYRIFHTHSHALFGFILIDVFFVYLIYHERRKLIVRRKRKLHKQQQNGANASESHDASGNPTDVPY